MDLKLIDEFSVLAQSRSFRQAAHKLGISPSLLSSHMASLEKKLETQLFKRSAHMLELTESGKCFFTDAREISAEWSQTLKSINAVSDNSYRSLRIGMSGFTIPAILGPFLDTVNLRYPGIDLSIFDDSRFGIPDGLGNGQIDIFFTYCDERTQYEGITKELLYTTKVLVLVPQNHRLAYNSSVSVSQLDGERFVLYPETAECSMRKCEYSLLEDSGITFSVYTGVACPSAHYVFVPIGKGLVLCPWVSRDMIPPNTVALSVDNPDFTMSMYMFYRRDAANPYLSEFLRDFRSFSFRRPET